MSRSAGNATREPAVSANYFHLDSLAFQTRNQAAQGSAKLAVITWPVPGAKVLVRDSNSMVAQLVADLGVSPRKPTRLEADVGSDGGPQRSRVNKKSDDQKQKLSWALDNTSEKVRELKIKLKRIRASCGNVTAKRKAGFTCGSSMGLTR